MTPVIISVSERLYFFCAIVTKKQKRSRGKLNESKQNYKQMLTRGE